MAKCAALEYAKRGIRINAVCPGTIVTPLVENMMKTGAITHIIEPIGRMGQPFEVASCVIWLCGKGAGFVTGQGIADKYADGRLLAIMEGGKGNYMSFCILKTIEAMAGEKAEVGDPAQGIIVRNYVTPDQEAAIDKVKTVLAPYWKL